MISTKELMLGNIIQYEYEGERFTARVKEIYKDSVLMEEVNGKYEEIEIQIQDIYPIELSPEMLEKNGFTIVHGFGCSEFFPTYGWGYCKSIRDQCFIGVTFYDEHRIGTSRLLKIETSSKHDSGVNSVHSCDCDYVHQLQNAIRLCGITKEIIV